MFFAYDANPKKCCSADNYVSVVLFWVGLVLFLISIGCSIRIYLRMLLPADGTGVCSDCSKMATAVAGSNKKGFPMLVDDGGGDAPGLEFAAIGAKLCDWVRAFKA